MIVCKKGFLCDDNGDWHNINTITKIFVVSAKDTGNKASILAWSQMIDEDICIGQYATEKIALKTLVDFMCSL